MAKTVGSVTNFSGGLSDSPKTGIPHSFAGGRSIDFRSNPNQVTVLPRPIKDSGSIVTDLVLWGERTCDKTWFYGNTGNLYKLESDVYSVAHTAPNSTGNGLAYYAEDRNLYFAQNETLGRLTQACESTGTFIDDFLGSVGGAPTNSRSLDLEASSSQSATRADTASLSQTGDITLEAYVKPESLPSGSGQMTIMSKWEEDATTQSYKLALVATSNFFGDGSDGSLTVSVDTTEAPIDGNCTGTLGANTLTVSNTTGTFLAGQKILIHQSRGSGAGTYQINSIQSVSGSTLTLADNLTFSPDHSATTTVAAKAQVRVLKQYSAVTINSGITYTAKAWDGLKGGIIAFLCSGTTTVTGTITASTKGFRGGAAGTSYGTNQVGGQGEGTSGLGTQTTVPNGNGGGGGKYRTTNEQGHGGGGGGHGLSGSNGQSSGYPDNTSFGEGGNAAGSANLTTMVFGGGGGGGGVGDGTGSSSYGDGGTGGGIVFVSSVTLTISGSVVSAGSTGEAGINDQGAGGAGAGGSILFKAQTATLGASLVTASGGSTAGGTAGGNGQGSEGRINLDYSTSYTGSTTPTLNPVVDSTLGSADGYALRLYISSTGSNSETYTQAIDNPQNMWRRFSVAWDASASTAYFYQNGVLLGTKTGTLTAIHDNASEFAIGAYTNSGGTRTGFFDGLVDDARVWGTLLSESQILQNLNQVLYGTESYLKAYYEFTSDVTDSQTSGLNDLTANNTPTYSTDVPFSGVTTRADQDQNNSSATGQTYTLATSINEGATHKQTFVPAKDPYKSIVVNINAVGTGDWTMTIHNSLNQTVASSTVVNANLHTSYYEFTLTAPDGDKWRPIIGATYHFHLTSTVADGIVVTGTTVDLETAYYTSHYQFLVDSPFHPMLQQGNLLCIGNERYLATLEAGDIYDPHRLTFPSGYKLRCLAYWREYLAMGFVRGDEIGDEDDGKIFFWDGTADTYNHFIDVPEGSINAMKTSRGLLHFIAGYSGDLMAYAGGDTATKLKRLPEYERDQSVTTYPGALNMWKGLTYLGTGVSDSDTIERGVYSWGSLNENYPPSLGMDYPLSLGVQTSSAVEVGCVFPVGKELYISWKNSNAYGIDKVTETNSAFAEAEIQMLRADFSALPRRKLPLMVRADFEPLRTGESCQLRYKADRGSWTDGSVVSTVGYSEARMNIMQEVKEVDVAVKLFSTTTSPVLTGVSLETELAESTRGI